MMRLRKLSPSDASAKHSLRSCLLGGWLGCLLASLLTPSLLHGDELNQLLARLELNRLQAEHIESVLAKTVNLGEQEKLRKTLARLYVAQLVDFVDNRTEFARVRKRLVELESKVSSLKDPEIRFERLKIGFQHGEFLLTAYREDRRRLSDLLAARALFGDLAGKFDWLQQYCEKRIGGLETFDAGENSLENLKADNEIERLSDISFRTSYFSGWSHFNHGLTQLDARAARPAFAQALAGFCDFLDVDPAGDVESWEESFLELGTTRGAQSLLGVSLCFLALGQGADADACFALLTSPNVAADVRDQLPFWQIQSLLEFGMLEDAAVLSKAYLARDSSLNGLQRGQIGLMLVRFANGDPAETFSTADEKKQRVDLQNLGFQMLAELQQFPLVVRLLDQFEIKLQPDNFYNAWIVGERQYRAAEQKGVAADYQLAAASLQAALRQAGEVRTIDVERCRHRLGWARYQAGEYSKAAKSFDLVFSRIARLDQRTAAAAAWLQHDCYLKQAGEDSRYIDKALAVLDSLVTRFPDAELARKARLQIVKLRQTSLDPDDAIKRLEEVVSKSPDDRLAQYELMLAWYRRYQTELRGAEAPAAETQSELEKRLDELLVVASELSPSQRLKANLVQVDLLLQPEKPDFGEIRSLFQRVQFFLDKVTNQKLLAELHYRQFQVAQRTGQEADVQTHVNWLFENGDGTVYQRSILVAHAKQIEEQISTASPSKANELYPRAVEIYRKLIEVTGATVQGVQSNQNARVAVSRLAFFSDQTGDREAAEQMLQVLVSAFPTNAGYLQRLARLQIEEKEYMQALELWRKLSVGLDRESTDWYEARYYVILCLSKTDLDSAKETLRQFRSLYPNPPDSWKPKFGQLEISLGIE